MHVSTPSLKVEIEPSQRKVKVKAVCVTQIGFTFTFHFSNCILSPSSEVCTFSFIESSEGEDVNKISLMINFISTVSFSFSQPMECTFSFIESSEGEQCSLNNVH